MRRRDRSGVRGSRGQAQAVQGTGEGAAAGGHHRLQHVIDPHRLHRRRLRQAPARRRPALFQSRAADEAGGSDSRRGDRVLGDRRADGAGQAAGQGAGQRRRHAGLPGQSRRHRHRHGRSAYLSGRRRQPGADRRHHARRLRLSHGPVRVDGPDWHRREFPRPPHHLRRLFPRPPHDPLAAARGDVPCRPAGAEDQGRLVRL